MIKINEREKLIIKFIKEGKNLAEIGRIFNLTRERVRQIKEKLVKLGIVDKSLTGGLTKKRGEL